MRTPTIHMNGTSREELIKQLGDAHQAVTEAISALCRACPNRRDYYVQGPGAINEALNEHRARLAKLNDVKVDLEQIVEAIS